VVCLKSGRWGVSETHGFVFLNLAVRTTF
jgi:hypothetical protein